MMPITMQNVRFYLDAEEVNYNRAKELGPEAIPFLLELVQGEDLALASKATYLASLIQTEAAVAVLQTAAASPEAVVRVAAASSLRNLPEVQAEKVLGQLVDDPDAGIRKVTLNSARPFRSLEIEAKLQQVAETDPEDFVRNAALSTVRIMQRKRQLP
jgi:hypothetical protein